jgi:hypothetical protein
VLSKKVNFVSFSHVFIMIVLDVSHSFIFKNTSHTSGAAIIQQMEHQSLLTNGVEHVPYSNRMLKVHN